MQTFDQAICDLIRNGTVQENEGMKFADHPDTARMNLKGIFLNEDKRILMT